MIATGGQLSSLQNLFSEVNYAKYEAIEIIKMPHVVSLYLPIKYL